jgi:asparagine synthase (glutamine-hydrolysing)
MYESVGFEEMIKLLDGVFAFILIDYDDIDNIKMFVGRDPFGVRPLFQGVSTYDNSFVFSSLMKQTNNDYKLLQYTPGRWSKYLFRDNSWSYILSKQYFSIYDIPVNPISDIKLKDHSEKKAMEMIYMKLCNAVKKRVDTTERPIACLLSGGLDSSLITSLVCKYYQTEYRKLETYSIGMEGSEDLKFARKVADFLGTKHNEIIVTEEDFLMAIPNVIYEIESYDTTTIRASVGNYLVAKYISEHSHAKVIFNGDGSDEVTGGYLYFHYSPDMLHFDIECKRLLSDIYHFDVLRSDRCISSNGLEARTPFLDKEFVTEYLKIPIDLRCNTYMINNKCEKYLLRKTFSDNNILPHDVIWRTKEAFSDGVSKQTRSWYEIIQEHVDRLNVDTMREQPGTNIVNTPHTKEQYYYRELFNKHYCNNQNIVPYFWMPRFIISSDASARTLSIYKDKDKHNNGVNDNI